MIIGVMLMYVTSEMILSVCIGFSAICVAGGHLIKIIKGLKKPGDDVKENIKGNKSKIDEQEQRLNDIDGKLDNLVTANNLVIRSLFTVLGELSVNNDANGHIAKAQKEIQDFLTPV